jgi:hypothetical protein
MQVRVKGMCEAVQAGALELEAVQADVGLEAVQADAAGLRAEVTERHGLVSCACPFLQLNVRDIEGNLCTARAASLGGGRRETSGVLGDAGIL